MIMKTKVNIVHLLDITGVAARACLHGKIRITRLLWENDCRLWSPFQLHRFPSTRALLGVAVRQGRDDEGGSNSCPRAAHHPVSDGI